MVMVVVFEFSVMRCQPLRRALGFKVIDEFMITENINKIYNESEVEFNELLDFLYKSPRFIKSEKELEDKKLESYFGDNIELKALRWAIHDRRLNKFYPEFLSQSNLFVTSSIFESYILKLCYEVELIASKKLKEKKVSGVHGLLKYLKDELGVQYSQLEIWQQIDSIIKIRNCLMHANGALVWSRNGDEIYNILNKKLFLSSKQREAQKKWGGLDDYYFIDEQVIGKVVKVKNEMSIVACGHYKEFLYEVCNLAYKECYAISNG
ncbi:hypothetical protein [Vibrio metoecus]|uniref:hypothetical protein n=1 Tax=Vibrio metoecus TaxID=1481663 RepID=UPI0015957175|nr:hypothetical protein [Vibrio metoecus]